MVKKYILIPRSFLVINICNQGKTLCSPCIYIPSLVGTWISINVAPILDQMALVHNFPLYRLRRP